MLWLFCNKVFDWVLFFAFPPVDESRSCLPDGWNGGEAAMVLKPLLEPRLLIGLRRLVAECGTGVVVEGVVGIGVEPEVEDAVFPAAAGGRVELFGDEAEDAEGFEVIAEGFVVAAFELEDGHGG